MLIWIVTHINQLMFSPIVDKLVLDALQFFSFIEVSVELMLVTVFTVMFIFNKVEK